MANFRALCAEFIDALDSGITAGRIRMSPLAHRARAALAEPQVIRTDRDEAGPYVLLAETHAALAQSEPEGLLADTHYEWDLEDADGEWQAGGSSNSRSNVEQEGMRYLQTYAQDGPHRLIIRQHTTQTINEIAND